MAYWKPCDLSNLGSNPRKKANFIAPFRLAEPERFKDSIGGKSVIIDFRKQSVSLGTDPP